MSAEPATLPPLRDLMKVFEIEDTAEQVRLAKTTVLPILARQMQETSATADEVYGTGWRDLVSSAQRPAPRDAESTACKFRYADCSWAAKRLRNGWYRTFTQAGRRTRILDARVGISVNAGEAYGRLCVVQEQAVDILGEVWRSCGPECLALLETGAPAVWGDVRLPGPPHTPLADHVENLLRSHPHWVVFASVPSYSDWSSASALRLSSWGVLCLLPTLVGVIEAALDRQPSVRAMHRRLCAWLLRDDGVGAERGPTNVSSGLRFRVFQRDGFRCVMCGATAATGANLEVDHIVPRARGGGNHIDNLQTLCDRCNAGKSAAFSPDLRRRR